MGKKKKGEELFNEFYAEQFGVRWDELRAALTGEKKHVAVKNPFVDTQIPGEEVLPGVFAAESFERPADEYYLMDAASVLAPRALEVKEGETVLDMCAAPGGKTLILAYALNNTGKLVANDRSRDRRERLRRVLENYLPNLDNIKITGHDSTQWGLHEQNVYDKILLDAPCSSEKHVLESPEHMKDWAVGRTKRLALTQGAMILAAFEALKPGGAMVYSTCALSELENDKVVAKLLKKKEAEIQDVDLPFGEKTEYGYAILPDKSGWGPFYLAKILKPI